MDITHINALNRFALQHQRGWREELSRCWLRAGYPSSTCDDDKALLQQLRNNGGPTILAAFTPRETDYRYVAYLKKDRKERLTTRSARWVTAWRLVTADGIDIVLPWCDSKDEARSTAVELGAFLAGELT